ncbi:uncharacterized protein LOC125679332 isoform X5 [Ostrea edulis]|uniref:uncharacterized protein LOC125679332 isoform X5 n=1 Tax=Ostrea edulis TaxID=37623 RepID=UPI0024AED20A|nr:uncharacterized protein LOC125679332 isoform X5 [Ostrea edulis]
MEMIIIGIIIILTILNDAVSVVSTPVCKMDPFTNDVGNRGLVWNCSRGSLDVIPNIPSTGNFTGIIGLDISFNKFRRISKSTFLNTTRPYFPMYTHIKILNVNCKMNTTTITNLEEIAEEMTSKGYQLEGVFSKISSRVPQEHASFFRKTLDEMQAMAQKLRAEFTNVESVYTSLKNGEQEIRNMRKTVSELKSMNYKLKRKLEKYETDDFDDSIMSSQEAVVSVSEATPSAPATPSDVTVGEEEGTKEGEQESPLKKIKKE